MSSDAVGPEDSRRLPAWLRELSRLDEWVYHDGEWWEVMDWLCVNRGRGEADWIDSWGPVETKWERATTPNGKAAVEDGYGIAISNVDGRPYVVLRGYPYDAAAVRTVERQFPGCRWRVSAEGIAYAEAKGRHVATVMRRDDEP